MIGRRSDIAWLQSDFFRDQFHKMVRWLIYAALIMLALIAVIIYLILFQPKQDYYANTTEGRILNMPTYSR